MEEFLDQLGPATRERPAPTLKGSIVAAAAALIVIGLAAVGADAYTEDGSTAVGVICGLVAVAVGHTLLSKLADVPRPAGITLVALGTGVTTFFLLDDVTSPTAALFVLTLAFGAQWVVGPARGEMPLLAAAVASLWLLLLDGLSSDDPSSFGDGAFFSTPDSPFGSGDDTTAYVSLVIGLLLLFAARAFDSDGYHGVATAGVLVGDLAFVTGVFGVIGGLDSDAGGSLLVVAAGGVLTFVGSGAGRRFTSWLGAIGILSGVLAVINTAIDFDDPIEFGLIAVVIGVIIVALTTLLDPGQFTRPAVPETPPPTPPSPETFAPQTPSPEAFSTDVAAHAQTTSEQGAAPNPAWHRDPLERHELRWWDGEKWTDQVCDNGQTSTDSEGT